MTIDDDRIVIIHTNWDLSPGVDRLELAADSYGIAEGQQPTVVHFHTVSLGFWSRYDLNIQD